MPDVDVFSSGYMGQLIYSQRSAASCDALCSDTFISKAALRFLATHHTQAKHNDLVTMSLLSVHQSSFLGPIWPRILRDSVQ